MPISATDASDCQDGSGKRSRCNKFFGMLCTVFRKMLWQLRQRKMLELSRLFLRRFRMREEVKKRPFALGYIGLQQVREMA